jgi:hypothetical protein
MQSTLLRFPFILERVTSFLTYQETINKFSLVSKLTNNLLKELEFFHLHNNLTILFTKENLKNNKLIHLAFKQMYTLVEFIKLTYKKQIILEIKNMLYKRIQNQNKHELCFFKPNDKNTLHIINNWSKKMHLNINVYNYKNENMCQTYSGTYFNKKYNIGTLTKEYFNEFNDDLEPVNIYLKATFAGKFINDKLNGQGVVTIGYKDENGIVTYEGEYVNNVLHGHGSMIKKSFYQLITYCGQYKEGFRHGHGIYTTIAFFENAQIIINDFTCILKNNEKYIYEGEFIDGRRHGHCIEETPHFRFEGEYIDDIRDLTQNYILKILNF